MRYSRACWWRLTANVIRRWWWRAHGGRWRSHITDHSHSRSTWGYHTCCTTASINLRWPWAGWHSRWYAVKSHFMRVWRILHQIVGSIGSLILIVRWWLRIGWRWISLWKLYMWTWRWIGTLRVITPRLTGSRSTSCISHPTTHWVYSTKAC